MVNGSEAEEFICLLGVCARSLLSISTIAN